jgi:hypothetical protein
MASPNLAFAKRNGPETMAAKPFKQFLYFPMKPPKEQINWVVESAAPRCLAAEVDPVS